MGLPQLDFRVPESTWFKSVLAGKFGVMPGLSSTGALAWPYKIAVVAVMTLVAGGTLVTFGSAGAETPSSSQVAALPGSDEPSPSVEGQVLPSTALLNGADLLSTLNLTDYSPGDTDLLSLSDDDDDDDDSDEDSDEDTEADIEKKLAAANSTSNPTTSPTTSAPSPEPTTSQPTTPAPEPTTTTEPPPAPTCVQKLGGLCLKWQ